MPSENANPKSGFKGRKASESFHEILRVDRSDGLGADMAPVTDGKGAVTPLSISDTTVAINNMVWPTEGAQEGAVLRVSSTTNQLEWSTEVPSGGEEPGAGGFDETAFWMGTI